MEYKAILCILGAILINLTLGTFYSIGNVIPYVASYMRNNGNPNVTTEHGTWITAAFLLGQGFFIIVGSFIEQKINNRAATIAGCVMHCASTFMTIWAIKINLLAVIIVYGFGSGIGAGSAYISSIIAAQKWFPRSKGIFTGIIVAGFGFGGLFFTSLQTMYMNPDNIEPDKSGYFSETVYKNVPNLFLYMGLIFTVAQSIGCILAFPPPHPSETGTKSAPDGSIPQGVTVVGEDSLPSLGSSWDAFGYRIFYTIGAMMMLVAPGVTFVNSLGKKYGQTFIKDDRYLATVVAVAAVANALGRLTWGFLMDKLSFSACYAIKVTLFAFLIALFPFEFILGSKALYFIWMLGLFFGFSGTFVLFPVFIEQVFGVKYHGMIYGVLYILLAIASVATSLLIQLTISADESLTTRLGPCLAIAALYIASLALYWFVIPVKKLESAIRRRVEMDYAKKRNTLFNRTDLFPLERGTLAEKTSSNLGGLERENSLGSIVRYRDTVQDDKKIKPLSKSPKHP